MIYVLPVLYFITEEAIRIHEYLAGVSELQIQQSINRAQWALISLLTFGLIVEALARGRGRERAICDKLLLNASIFVILADLLGFVVGISRGNSITYVVGDTFRFGVFPLLLVGTVMTIRRDNVRALFWLLVVLGILSTFGTFVRQGIALLGEGLALVGRGTGIEVLPLVFMCVSLFSTRKRSGQKAALVIMVLAFVVGGLLSLKRSALLMLPMTFAIAMVVCKKWKQLFGVIIVMVVAFLNVSGSGILADVYSNVSYSIMQSPFNRYVVGGGWEEAQGLRLLEVERALLTMKHDAGGIWTAVVGMGNGGEYYMPEILASELGTRDGYVHTIHNTYVSVFFRMGIVGLGSWMYFLIVIMSRVFRLLRHQVFMELREVVLVRAIFVYFIVDWLLALTAYRIGDIYWGILFGVIGQMSGKLHRAAFRGLSG